MTKTFYRRAQDAKERASYYGVVYANQWSYVGMCIEDLEIMANIYELEDIINYVTYLPL